ncbi:hypothetical protein LCGC14_1301670 [marine sediment metagenome]|uniref:DRBM domain-containing protein n=1 Tax=marine sediment metagenome TaxID=412755 RepID=A0A0F9N600_9ZZZZ
MTNEIDFTVPVRRVNDGKYVVLVYINGGCFGSAVGGTPAQAQAAAKRLLRNIGRRPKFYA